MITAGSSGSSSLNTPSTSGTTTKNRKREDSTSPKKKVKISSISKDDFYAANVVNKLNTIENEVTRRKLAASLLFAVVEQQALDEKHKKPYSFAATDDGKKTQFETNDLSSDCAAVYSTLSFLLPGFSEDSKEMVTRKIDTMLASALESKNDENAKNDLSSDCAAVYSTLSFLLPGFSEDSKEMVTRKIDTMLASALESKNDENAKEKLGRRGDENRK